jgi:hypothetical protein
LLSTLAVLCRRGLLNNRVRACSVGPGRHFDGVGVVGSDWLSAKAAGAHVVEAG